MMRLKYAKLLIVFVFLVCFCLWKWFLFSETNMNSIKAQSLLTNKATKLKDRIRSTNKHISKEITVIFRDFYHFENDLHHSIDSILNLVPHIEILVIYEGEPYPPLNFMKNYSTLHSNVKFIDLSFDVSKTSRALMPLLHVRTKYVLFVPDSFRFGGRAILQKMLAEIQKEPHQRNPLKIDGKSASLSAEPSIAEYITRKSTNSSQSNKRKPSTKKVVVIPFASNLKTSSNCCYINIDIANWTMEYSVRNDSQNCDMFLQKHAILADANMLRTLPNALASPFPEMFYIQIKMFKAKVKLLTTGSLQDGKRLFTAFHNKQLRKDIRKQQLAKMYKTLQIKKVVRKYVGKSGKSRSHEKKQHLYNNPMSVETVVLANNKSLPLLTSVEYFGCEKNTRSCIGSVYNKKPFYVYLARNTPPCCLEKLKSVFNRVLEEFENVGIRYWLDNLALKSAMETNQLAHDAYEIDISFNCYDLERSTLLKKAQIRPVVDSFGFYWIKATDGQYTRVQFSKQNQVGVNLLPFSIVADRARANGFFGWKAKEFPAEFLHPMSTVIFLNKNVMSPNNVRDFLSFKNMI